jgi:hypothetical protein
LPGAAFFKKGCVMNVRINVLCLLLAACVFSACIPLRPAKVPMDSILIPRPAATSQAPARTLIVFLPGAMEVPQDLVTQGFIAQVHARGIDADVQVIDAHIGYFTGRSFDKRIREDIFLPARARGYTHIWFAGISLGGFGSLMYAYLFPGEVDGIIAIAPYIASRSTWREVLDAGGLAQWQPPQPLKDSDYERGLMAWLKAYGAPGVVATKQRPPLLIGFGDADGMPQFDQLIKGTLTEAQLLRAPGGHDWPPWKIMWADALERAPLPRLPKQEVAR